MAKSFPITQFRSQTRSGSQITTSDTANWIDIEGLVLEFDEADSGNFLVTLTVSDTWNSFGSSDVDFGAQFQLVSRLGSGDEQKDGEVLGQGGYTSVVNQQRIPFSLICSAKVSPAAGGSRIVAQWQAVNGGTAVIGGGTSTLSAVGSLQLRKDAYDDKNHFEYPELFSRGLRLTNLSETLFLTGYSATPPLDPDNMPITLPTATAQMKWIVAHLDDFFATIPYADGTGSYSKYDIVYFDLVIDKTVDADDQEGVLKVLEGWFGPQPGKLAVIPKPSTGILKKIEALAFSTTKVEIEFILAH